MNKKRWISAMLIVTLTCGLGLTACGGTQGSVPGTEEAEVQLDLFETAHIRLECPYRLNQKDWKPTFILFANSNKDVPLHLVIENPLPL